MTGSVNYTYDAAGQTTQLYNLKPNGDVLSSFDYDYDGVGNRTQGTEADGKVVSWEYDKLNRLTHEQKGAVETLGWLDFTLDQWKEMTLNQWLEFELNETAGASTYNITHIYDPVGNRLVKEQDGARTTYTYDAANQLTSGQDSTGVTTYTYDKSGNLEVQEVPSNQITTHIWNIENRLTRVLLPSDVVNTMIYDADGLRVQRDDSTGVSKSIWDLQNLLIGDIGELKGTGVKLRFTCPSSGLVARGVDGCVRGTFDGSPWNTRETCEPMKRDLSVFGRRRAFTMATIPGSCA